MAEHGGHETAPANTGASGNNRVVKTGKEVLGLFDPFKAMGDGFGKHAEKVSELGPKIATAAAGAALGAVAEVTEGGDSQHTPAPKH